MPTVVVVFKTTPCLEKRDQMFFWKYLRQNSGDSGEIWYINLRINLLQNYVDVFHLP